MASAPRTADALLSKLLKPFLLRALRRYLDAYFVLDASVSAAQLDVVASKSEIALSNLTIKPSGPFGEMSGLELESGTVGHLKLKLPWAHLSSESATLTLSDVRLVAKRKADLKTAVRMETLRAAQVASSLSRPAASASDEEGGEEEDEDEEDAGEGGAEGASDDKQAGSSGGMAPSEKTRQRKRLMSRLLDNVVCNVHTLSIRFLDEDMCVSVDEVAFETTDESFKAAFVDRTNSPEALLFRVGVALGLQVTNLAGTRQLVKPFSFSLQSKTDAAKRQTVLVRAGSVAITLASFAQLYTMRGLLPPPTRKQTRPPESPLVLPRAWWAYVLDRIKARCTWRSFMRAFRLRRDYLASAKRKDQASITALEAKMPLSTVLLFRAFAKSQQRRAKPSLVNRLSSLRLRRPSNSATPEALRVQRSFETIALDMGVDSGASLTVVLDSLSVDVEGFSVDAAQVHVRSSEAQPVSLQCASLSVSHGGKSAPVFSLVGAPVANAIATSAQARLEASSASASRALVKLRSFSTASLAGFTTFAAASALLSDAPLPPWRAKFLGPNFIQLSGPSVVAELSLIKRLMDVAKSAQGTTSSVPSGSMGRTLVLRWEVSSPRVVIPGLLRLGADSVTTVRCDQVVLVLGKFESQPFDAIYDPRRARFVVSKPVEIDVPLDNLLSLARLLPSMLASNGNGNENAKDSQAELPPTKRPALLFSKLALTVSLPEEGKRAKLRASAVDVQDATCSDVFFNVDGVELFSCRAGLAIQPGSILNVRGEAVAVWHPQSLRGFIHRFASQRPTASTFDSSSSPSSTVSSWSVSSSHLLSLRLMDLESSLFAVMQAHSLANVFSPSQEWVASDVVVRDYWNEAQGRVVLEIDSLVRARMGSYRLVNARYDHWHTFANEVADYWESAVVKVAQLRGQPASAGVSLEASPLQVRLFPCGFAKDFNSTLDALVLDMTSFRLAGDTPEDLSASFGGLEASSLRAGKINNRAIDFSVLWQRPLLLEAQRPQPRNRVLGILSGQGVSSKRRHVVRGEADLDGLELRVLADVAQLLAGVAVLNIRDWRRADPTWDDVDKAPEWTRALRPWRAPVLSEEPFCLFDASFALEHVTVELASGPYVFGSLVQAGLRVSLTRQRTVFMDVYGDVSGRHLYLSGAPSLSWQTVRADGDERACLSLGAITRSSAKMWSELAYYGQALMSVSAALTGNRNVGARAVTVFTPSLRLESAIAESAEATMLRTANGGMLLVHGETQKATLSKPFNEPVAFRVDASQPHGKPWRISLVTGKISLRLSPTSLAHGFTSGMSSKTSSSPLQRVGVEALTAMLSGMGWGKLPKAIVLVSVPAVSITLLSITNDAPTLALRLSRLVLKHDSSEANDVASLTFLFGESEKSTAGLAVDFFNLNLVQWEPLIEPVLFDVILEASQTTRSMAIEVSGPMCVNVSPPLVHALSRLAPSARDIGQHAPFLSQWVLRNETGLAFELRQGKKAQACAVGENIPLEGWNPRLPCTMDFGAQWFPVSGLWLDKIGTTTHPLYPVAPPQRRSLVCFNVAMVDGSMVASAFGPVQIKNSTDDDLDVLLLPEPQPGFDQNDGDRISEHTLIKGASLSLSVLDVACRLSIRPADSGDYEFWTGVELAQLCNGVSVHGLCANPAGSFHFNVAVTKEPTGRMRLEVLPTVVVYNGLPVPLAWRLVTSAVRSSLPPGTIGRSHASHDDLLMSLCVQGSAWSVAFRVDADSTRPIPVEDPEGKQLTVIVETLSERGGSRRVVVYARAWFLNKTELPLSFKAGSVRLFDAVSQTMETMGINMVAPSKIGLGTVVELMHEDMVVAGRVVAARPDGTYDVMVMVGEDNEEVCVGGVSLSRLRMPASQDYVIFSETYCSLRVDDEYAPSFWSESFSIDEAKARGFALLPRAGNRSSNMLGDRFCLAIDVEPSPMSWKRTPIVVLRPQCIVVNDLVDWVVVLTDVASTHRVRIPPGTRSALHCDSLRARLSLDDPNEPAGDSSSSLTATGFSFSGILLLNSVSADGVTLQNKRSGTVVVVSVVITTDKSQVRVTIGADPRQYLLTNRSPSMIFFSQAGKKGAIVQSLMPGESKSFGFEETVVGSDRCVEFMDSASGSKALVRPDVLNLPPVALGSHWLISGVDRASKVVVVSENKNTVAGDEFSPRLGSDQVAIRQVFVRCSELYVSLVDSRPQELVCAYFRGLELAGVQQAHSSDDKDYSVVCEARYCQVDNCLLGARMPVLTWPQTLPRTFLRIYAAGRQSGRPMWVLSDARVSVQPVDVYVEEALAILLVRWTRDCRRAWTALQPTSQSRAEATLLVDTLRVDALKMSLSMQCLVDDPKGLFGFPEWRGPGNALEPYDWRPLLSSLGLSLADVDRASVVLKMYEVRRAVTTPRGLFRMARTSYERDALANLYYIVSTEFITSLVAPAYGGGLRPADTGDLKSLGHLAAYNTLDSVSKSFGALGSGLAFLSLDPGFVAARRAQIIDDRPDSVADGMVQAARALGMGLLEGVGGVITQPVIGAQEHGLEGFVLGVGRGIVGVAVKPAVAVFDSLASVLAGARTSTASLDAAAPPRRCRLPRAFQGEARLLVPYDSRAALVQELLVRVWGSLRYQELASGVSFELLSKNQVIIAYQSRVLCLDYTDLVRVMDSPLQVLRAARVDVMWEMDGHAVLEAWPRSATEINVALAYRAGCFVGFKGDDARGRGNPFLIDDVLAIPTSSQQDGRTVLNCILMACEKAAGGDRPVRQTPFGLTTGRSSVGWHSPASAAADQAEKRLDNDAINRGAVRGILPNDEPLGKCFVHKVDDGSQAQLAGFRVGDCVLACMGRRLDADDVDGLALHDALARLPSHARLNVVVQRRNKVIVLDFEVE